MPAIKCTDPCSVEGCKNPIKCRGYCQKHYFQVRKHGKTFNNTKCDFNEITDKGSYLELTVLNRKYEKVGKIKIDKCDLDLVKSVGRWRLDKDGYATNGTNGTVFMHRIIMEAEDDDEVDSRKTGVKYRSDNRRKNLRLATRSQNTSNSRTMKINTSGYRGVQFDKRRNHWIAELKFEGVRYYLGSFKTKEEAHDAYVKAAKKHRKEFYHDERKNLTA